MARNSTDSPLRCTSLWLKVSRKHLDQEQKEHQTNNAEDDDEDDDGDCHEHVNARAKVGDAVLDLFIFFVPPTVDLPVAEQLPPDALGLFSTGTPPIVMVVGCAVLLERGDNQLQLLVGLTFSCGMHNQPKVDLLVHVFNIFPA